jgi:hypothetical protein
MAGDPRRSDELLERLDACDPLPRSVLAGEGIQDALDEVGAAIARRPRRPSPRARRLFGSRRAVLVVAAAILTISVGVATGADVMGARTGLFPTKAEQVVGGPGEQLNPAAPDFQVVALRIASDIPYPTGYESWREWVLKIHASTAETGPGGAQFPGGLVSSGALRGWFAASSFCAWVQSWREAAVSGDANAAAQAAQMIAQAPSWRAVTDLDPHPDPSSANDPGAESGTVFGWLLPYRDAVLAGDRGRVEHLLSTGYGNGRCWLSDPEWMAREKERGTLSPRELKRRYEQFLTSERS